jgi:predicted nucleic acid-binding protein
MNEQFVYDTYALIEILKENPSYLPYTEFKPIINEFIFAEFCYNLFKDNIENPEIYIEEVKSSVLHTDLKWIEEAMKFRLKWKKRKVSMADCIGYIVAEKLGIKFLTGDKEFYGMENVEFVR